MYSFITAAVALVASTLPLASAAPAGTIQARNSGSFSYYDPSGAPGACGTEYAPTDLIVALDESLWSGDNLCGKSIHVKGPAGSHTVKVVDKCPGCGANGVDMTASLFEIVVGPQSIGRADGSWAWA